MKLGVFTALFGQLRVEEALDHVAQMGLQNYLANQTAGASQPCQPPMM